MRNIIPFVAALVLLAGCAALDPNADPLVVRAEQVQQVTYDTFNTFLTIDNTDRALFKSKFPDAHAVAEWLRAPVVQLNGTTTQRGLSILNTLSDVKMAYKNNRSPENKARLTAELARVEGSLAQVQEQLAKVKGQ